MTILRVKQFQLHHVFYGSLYHDPLDYLKYTMPPTKRFPTSQVQRPPNLAGRFIFMDT